MIPEKVYKHSDANGYISVYILLQTYRAKEK